MFNTATQVMLRQEREQERDREKRITDWLLGGGGGFEGGADGARAVSFTFLGAVELLAAYEEYLMEKIQNNPTTTLFGVPLSEVRRALLFIQQESGRGITELRNEAKREFAANIEAEADRLYEAMEVPGVVPTEVRRILRRVSGK